MPIDKVLADPVNSGKANVHHESDPRFDRMELYRTDLFILRNEMPKEFDPAFGLAIEKPGNCIGSARVREVSLHEFRAAFWAGPHIGWAYSSPPGRTAVEVQQYTD
jgi:hypothetical protein